MLAIVIIFAAGMAAGAYLESKFGAKAAAAAKADAAAVKAAVEGEAKKL